MKWGPNAVEHAHYLRIYMTSAPETGNGSGSSSAFHHRNWYWLPVCIHPLNTSPAIFFTPVTVIEKLFCFPAVLLFTSKIVIFAFIVKPGDTDPRIF